MKAILFGSIGTLVETSEIQRKSYNLAFENLTDCISINLNYNKTFYSDGNLEPDNTLSFLINSIPLLPFFWAKLLNDSIFLLDKILVLFGIIIHLNLGMVR